MPYAVSVTFIVLVWLAVVYLNERHGLLAVIRNRARNHFDNHCGIIETLNAVFEEGTI